MFTGTILVKISILEPLFSLMYLPGDCKKHVSFKDSHTQDHVLGWHLSMWERHHLYPVCLPRSGGRQDRKASGDVAADDAWGEEGKDALCWACWDLCPNGEKLIAGKSSF